MTDLFIFFVIARLIAPLPSYVTISHRRRVTLARHERQHGERFNGA